jgi:hypothetical protein
VFLPSPMSPPLDLPPVVVTCSPGTGPRMR